MYLYNSMLCPNGAIQSINHFLSPDIQSFAYKDVTSFIYFTSHSRSKLAQLQKLQEAHPLLREQIDLSE